MRLRMTDRVRGEFEEKTSRRDVKLDSLGENRTVLQHTIDRVKEGEDSLYTIIKALHDKMKKD